MPKNTAYYARQAKISFYANVEDKDGTVIHRENGKGEKMYKDGNPVPLQVKLEFTTLSNVVDKQICVFKVDENTPRYVIKALEKLRKDPAMKIMTEAEKEKFYDPAGVAEREAKQAQEEKTLLQSQLTDKDKEIAELKKRLGIK